MSMIQFSTSVRKIKQVIFLYLVFSVSFDLVFPNDSDLSVDASK